MRARASVHPCAFVRGAACVHGHEDPGSKRSRGPSGSDPSTPARIRHTRTPMLRGRTRRCLGGVPGLYPAGLRLPPLFLLSSLLPSSSPTLFATPSPPRLFSKISPFLSLFLLLLPVPPVLILCPLSSPPFLLHLLYFSSSSSFLPSLRSARRAYMYIRGINSRSPRKNDGNVITTLSFARSCLLDPP